MKIPSKIIINTTGVHREEITKIKLYIKEFFENGYIPFDIKVKDSKITLYNFKKLWISLTIMNELEQNHWSWDIELNEMDRKIPTWVGIEHMNNKYLIGLNLEYGNNVEQYNELEGEWEFVNRFSIRYGEEQQIFDKNNELC